MKMNKKRKNSKGKINHGFIFDKNGEENKINSSWFRFSKQKPLLIL